MRVVRPSDQGSGFHAGLSAQRPRSRFEASWGYETPHELERLGGERLRLVAAVEVCGAARVDAVPEVPLADEPGAVPRAAERGRDRDLGRVGAAGRGRVEYAQEVVSRRQDA